MQPKKIKACGKLKPEVQVEAKERDTLAYRMAVDGVSNTPEYISFVDKQVAEGTWTDAVAQEIRARISESPSLNLSVDLTGAIVDAANELARNTKAMLLARVKPAKTTIKPAKHVQLTKQEEKEVNAIMHPMIQDACYKDMHSLDEALDIIRTSVIKKLGIEDGLDSDTGKPIEEQFCINTNDLLWRGKRSKKNTRPHHENPAKKTH